MFPVSQSAMLKSCIKNFSLRNNFIVSRHNSLIKFFLKHNFFFVFFWFVISHVKIFFKENKTEISLLKKKYFFGSRNNFRIKRKKKYKKNNKELRNILKIIFMHDISVLAGNAYFVLKM